MKDYSDLTKEQLTEELGKVDTALSQCGYSAARPHLIYIRKLISSSLGEKDFKEQFLGQAEKLEDLEKQQNFTDDELAHKENKIKEEIHKKTIEKEKIAARAKRYRKQKDKG